MAAPPEQDAALDELEHELASLSAKEQAERLTHLLNVAAPRRQPAKLDERTLNDRIETLARLAAAAKPVK